MSNQASALILSAACVFLFPAAVLATFSIVAVDTVNNVVGGAGASCIAGCQMIDDVIEGIGAVHTQAWYNADNQANAHSLLAAGWTPDSIITWLYYHDAEGDPDFRQYGIVTLAGPGTSGAFTGAATTSWKGHRTGPGYAIQGNILLGAQIVDSMEFAFLNTDGPLEDKLMAALEAANVPGADTRCMSCNKPAISAFIKVVHIGDGATPYLYRLVNNTTCPQNPIDSLRILYDAWKELKYADPELSTVEVSPSYLPANGDDSTIITVTPLNYNSQPPSDGSEVELAHSGDGTLSAIVDNGDGTFTASLKAPLFSGQDTIKATVTAGGEVVELNQKPAVGYFLCGDANGNGIINILDITYIVSYLYKNGPAPIPVAKAGEANGNDVVNILDITYLINYVYKGGPAPICHL
jgi:uncharacterized Ntn-hydrolase superfamily protein